MRHRLRSARARQDRRALLVGDPLQRQARVVAQPALGDRPLVGARDVVEDDDRVVGEERREPAPRRIARERLQRSRRAVDEDEPRALADQRLLDLGAVPLPAPRRPGASPASRRGRSATWRSRRWRRTSAAVRCACAGVVLEGDQPASADPLERIAEDERRDAGAAARRRATASACGRARTAAAPGRGSPTRRASAAADGAAAGTWSA